MDTNASVIPDLTTPRGQPREFRESQNISFLMEKTAQGEFAHCGFIFAATEDLFHEDFRGIASYHPSSGRLQAGSIKRLTPDDQQPLILLKGFDHPKLYEITLKVRCVHGIAYDWNPTERLTDGLLWQLVEEVAVRYGEKFGTIPRGFLRVFVDILDALEQNPHISAAEVLAADIDADRIEEIEREEAHLLNHG